MTPQETFNALTEEQRISLEDAQDKVTVEMLNSLENGEEIKLNDFLIKWTGYVLCFYPKGEISYFKSDNKLPKLFRDFLKKEKKLIGQILLSSLILTFLTAT